MARVNTGKSERQGRIRHAQWLWTATEIAVGAVAVFCPLAIATVHPWATGVAAAIAFAACALAATAAMRSGEPFLVPAPGLALGAAAAFIAFQLVPLPPAVVGLLAPSTRELFDFVLGPLELYPAWRPLSLDPPATARELVKALTYLCAFFAASQVARSRRARKRMVTLLGVAGLVVALVGFGHALWGATELFGVFSYTYAQPPFLSTFGNPNHLASFLALGATALLARVLGERDRKIATIWSFAYVATGAGVLLTLSRGGIVAFVVAQVMLGIAVHSARRSEREGRPVDAKSLVVPGAVLAVLAISAYLAWDALAQELATADSLEKVKDSKISFWPSFLPLVVDHWLVGVGRGAFEPAFQRFQDVALGATVTHPENIVFQWITELGVPMGLFVLGASVVALLGGARRAAGDVERLACAFGLAAIGLHELVDFGLELGGLAVPAMVALALVASRGETSRKVRRAHVLIALPVALVVAVPVFGYSLRSLESDGKALAGKIGAVAADELAGLAADLAARHPADYFAHLVVARAYANERPLRPERVVAWASRAMFLNAARPEPHRLAARALRAIGQERQARLEYRLAFERGDRDALKEVTRAFQKPEELLEAVPDEEATILALADALFGQSRIDEAQAVARASLERHGESLPAFQRLARAASARRQPDEVYRIGGKMTVLAPEKPTGLLTRVNALIMTNAFEAAIELLEREGLKRFPLDAEVVMTLARLELSRGNTKACREALKKLPPGIDVSMRVRALSMEASAAERDGQASKALGFMRTALAMRPDDAGLRWRYANLLERIGRFDLALREAEAAAAKSPGLKVELDHMRKRVEAKKFRLEEQKRWQQLGLDGAPK
ncbi:MAG: O-antigen ligase family protein [Myxococcales bacterium]